MMARWAWLLLSLIFLSGCATDYVVARKREGLFDRLSAGTYSQQSSSSRNRPAVAVANIGPAVAAPVAYAKGNAAFGDLKLRWPLEVVQISSRFGSRGKAVHDGVDLAIRSGASVYAAEAGTVLYADHTIRGYGSMIVIRHRNNISTVYGHNSRLLVGKGQRVERGQRIAIAGRTGKATGSHLHFEVRQGIQSINPLTVMPQLSSKSRIALEKPKYTKKFATADR